MEIDAYTRHPANYQGIAALGLTNTRPIQRLHRYRRLLPRINYRLTQSGFLSPGGELPRRQVPHGGCGGLRDCSVFPGFPRLLSALQGQEPAIVQALRQSVR